MKKLLPVFLLLFSLFCYPPLPIWAEDRPVGQAIPTIPKTPDDPILINAHVYPMWGPICQRYTYSVVYQDKQGRPPEYVRMYFNGNWIDIEKENPEDNDYAKGVRYIYKFVPKKIGSNFYFFEASNGLGKARDGIIDSPDNGPVLFETAFDKNEIALIDAQTGQKVWSYPLAKKWVGGIALSDDGKYLATQVTGHIYLFETGKNEPLWDYEYGGGYTVMQNDVKGGIDISADGSYIFASIGGSALLFSKSSNQPLWEDKVGNQCYNVAMNPRGEYLAAACAGTEEDVSTNLLIIWYKDSSKRLWQYHSSGNFHDVSFTADGSLLAAATGCPDRRGYLFSKDSNEPIWKTEMLTTDSPVHRAKISVDGTVIAFGSESGEGAIHLFSKDSHERIWKFAAPGQPSFRALSVTPNGSYIGGATTINGNTYIFSKDSNEPLASWKFNTRLGACDIADDGSFLAVGGTDKYVRILERDSKREKASVELGEYIGEIDVSANGQYVAAGTSGSVYFFESLDVAGGEVECDEITEPGPEPTWVPDSKIVSAPVTKEETPSKPTYCGDKICEDSETLQNCPQDCDAHYPGRREEEGTQGKRTIFPPWLTMVFGGCFLVSVFSLGGYLAVIKLRLFKKPLPEEEKPRLNRKIVIILSVVTVLTLILTLVSFVTQRYFAPAGPEAEEQIFMPEEQLTPQPEVSKPVESLPETTPSPGAMIESKESGGQDQEEKQAVCGNTICEPDLGENKDNCPQDCSLSASD